MICSRRDITADSSLPRWRHDILCQARIHTIEEMDEVLAVVQAEMTEAGYDERDLFAVRLSLEEALINALKHGNGADPKKDVRVQWQVDGEQVLARIEDQGDGFDPEKIADPFAPENVDKASGRGVFLMRYYLSWVRYNERGNGVTLCKQRAA